MSERTQQHIYAVVTHPHEEAILLHEETLPRFDLSERGDRTHESFVIARIREQHRVITQVNRGLQPIDGALGYRMSVVRNTAIPESALWTPHAEIEHLLDDELALRIVRNALTIQRELAR